MGHGDRMPRSWTGCWLRLGKPICDSETLRWPAGIFRAIKAAQAVVPLLAH
jgi:hypothetical protein